MTGKLIKNITKSLVLAGLCGFTLALASVGTKTSALGVSIVATDAGPTTLNCAAAASVNDARCAKCQASSKADCIPDSVTNNVTAKCDPKVCDLTAKYINPFIKLLSAAVGVVVVLSIIYGAIQYSSSAGDPQKAAKARGHITKTVLALVVYIFFFAFLQFIVPGGVIR